MKHFEWMVIHRIDKEGIWFTGTTTGMKYVFRWNPIKVIIGWIRNGMYFGLPPMHIKHLKYFNDNN